MHPPVTPAMALQREGLASGPMPAFGNLNKEAFKAGALDQKTSDMLYPIEIAATLVHVLETPDNVLIDKLTLGPLNAKRWEL